MIQAEFQEHVDRARREVASQLARYRCKASQEMNPTLALLGEHVIASETTAFEVLRKAGLANTESKEMLERLTGVSPTQLINQLRVGAAKPLLAKTDLPIWVISKLVGYASAVYFRQVFKDISGITPGTYRAQEISKPEDLPVAHSPDPFSESRRRLLLRGTGSDQAKIEIIKTLAVKRFPIRRKPENIQAQVVDLRDFETWLVEYLGSSIPGCLEAEFQNPILESTSLFTTPALFDHLLRQSRVKGRGNRLRGVEIAELALRCLQDLSWNLTEENLAHLRARGWAWLGSARELAEDLGGAEEALNQAEALIAAFPPAPFRVQTEILYFRSCLRTRQRQVEEALDLAGHALDLAQTFDCAELRAEIFIARGNAAYSVADWPPALEDYRSAESLMTADSNAYLQLAAQHGVAWTAFKLGLLSEARDARLRGKKSAKNLGDQSVMPRLAWLEGLIALEDDDYGSAERILRSTRESFVLEGNYRNQGLVSLDLALTLYYIGNFAELKALMLETLPIFEYLRLDAEALALVDILRHSVSRNKIEARVLTQLRNRLEQS